MNNLIVVFWEIVKKYNFIIQRFVVGGLPINKKS